jgi:hypothetical protein
MYIRIFHRYITLLNCCRVQWRTLRTVQRRHHQKTLKIRYGRKSVDVIYYNIIIVS